MKPITVSFKKTPEEMQLYKLLSDHSSKAAYIKDVLIDVLIKKKKVCEIETANSKSDDSVGGELEDIFDM